MPSGKTSIQKYYPIPDDFVALAKKWHPDAISIMLEFVWQGFDKLAKDSFNIAKDDENLENDITYAVFCKIQDIVQFSSFRVIHQPPEIEKRKSAGQSPASDLGFRLIGGNIRSHFSIEAKVMRTDGDVSKYVKEINENYLMGRYSTFSSEAAMLGYLLCGDPKKAFKAISKNLNCLLKIHPVFHDRSHRISNHIREKKDFSCHHMIILFSDN